MQAYVPGFLRLLRTQRKEPARLILNFKSDQQHGADVQFRENLAVQLHVVHAERCVEQLKQTQVRQSLAYPGELIQRQPG